MVSYERLMYNYHFITRQVIHELMNNFHETENEDTFYVYLKTIMANHLQAKHAVIAADLTKYSDYKGSMNYPFRVENVQRTIRHNTN